MSNSQTTERQPFNPSNPFDAMAETIRREVCNIGLRALSTTIYRELDGHKQLECFLAGAMSGLISVAFAHIEPQGRDMIMNYIKECLPIARRIVDEIETGGRAERGG